MQVTLNKDSSWRWLVGFALLHVFFWTLVPGIIHHNAPLDVAEAIAWGQQWQWGYDRDPYLVGWLAYSVSWLTGHSVWATYFLSQVCIVATFWAIWRLALNLKLSAPQALLSILLLEGVFYYNFATPEFNDNVLQLPTWALTISFLYTALTTQRLRSWVLVGLFAGLALMAKYYTVMLFLPIFLLIVGTGEGRQSFKRGGIYFAIAIGLIIIAPNIYWQYQHGFQYVGYALSRAAVESSWHTHWYHPLLFLATQLVALLPCFLLYGWCVRSFKSASVQNASFDRLFLLLMTWGPFATTLAYAAFTGTHMRSMWGMPLFSFVGLWLVFSLWPRIDELRYRRLIHGALLSFFVALISYIGTVFLPPYIDGHAKTVSYPSVELAALVGQVWHQHYNSPLPYVAGTRQLAARVAVYADDHPVPFFDWDPSVSPWVNVEKMQRDGAVFVWDAAAFGDDVPLEVRKTYPRLMASSIVEIPWHTKAAVKPIRVGVALLPPESLAPTVQ